MAALERKQWHYSVSSSPTKAHFSQEQVNESSAIFLIFSVSVVLHICKALYKY